MFSLREESSLASLYLWSQRMASQLPEPLALLGRARKFECFPSLTSPKTKRFNSRKPTLTDVMDITASRYSEIVIFRS